MKNFFFGKIRQGTEPKKGNVVFEAKHSSQITEVLLYIRNGMVIWNQDGTLKNFGELKKKFKSLDEAHRFVLDRGYDYVILGVKSLGYDVYRCSLVDADTFLLVDSSKVF